LETVLAQFNNVYEFGSKAILSRTSEHNWHLT